MITPDKSYISLIVVCLFFSACSGNPRWVSVPKASIVPPQQNKDSSSQLPERSSDEIAPGFLLQIKSSDPKVAGEYRVGFDGSVKLPYEVQLQTLGLREKQLQAKVWESYRNYFRSPSDVNVSIAKKEFFIDVQGLVKKPGQYVFQQNSSLDELISQAGGLQDSTSRATSANYARINSQGETRFIKLAEFHAGVRDSRIKWSGGEEVFFQSEGGRGVKDSSVQVLGQVKNPAEYVAEDNGDFFTYLIKAGGPTERADLGNVTLIRADATQTQAITFDAQDFDQIPQVLSGDTIIVNSDVPTALEKRSRVGANFGSIISALGLIAVAAAP